MIFCANESSMSTAITTNFASARELATVIGKFVIDLQDTQYYKCGAEAVNRTFKFVPDKTSTYNLSYFDTHACMLYTLVTNYKSLPNTFIRYFTNYRHSGDYFHINNKIIIKTQYATKRYPDLRVIGFGDADYVIEKRGGPIFIPCNLINKKYKGEVIGLSFFSTFDYI